VIRSYAPGFIFTTSLSPVLVAGVLARRPPPQASRVERDGQQAAAATLKAMFRDAGLPVMNSTTHIVPVMVGDPVRPRRSATSCSPNMASTSSRSISRPCRAAPNACASPRAGAHEAMMAELVSALVEIWERLELKMAA
jgi:5-aminolevulinate synthase